VGADVDGGFVPGDEFSVHPDLVGVRKGHRPAPVYPWPQADMILDLGLGSVNEGAKGKCLR
jgi:hypothetical protein